MASEKIWAQNSFKQYKERDGCAEEKTQSICNPLKKKEKDLRINMRKKWCLDVDGLDTELEHIMGTCASVYKEAHYRCDLISVWCVRLIDKQNNIINTFKNMCSRRHIFERTIHLHRDEYQTCSVFRCFQALDVNFSRLCTVHLTNEECAGIDLSLRILACIYDDVKVAITPNSHMSFIHAA